jgi:hypothetical protein
MDIILRKRSSVQPIFTHVRMRACALRKDIAKHKEMAIRIRNFVYQYLN